MMLIQHNGLEISTSNMEFITSDGTKIHFSINGEGRAIIFLHGWTMTEDVYFYQQGAFENWKTITVDCRGHGRSDKKEQMDVSFSRIGMDIAELIVELDIDMPVLAGWSMGASIILSSLRILQPLCNGFIFLSGTSKFIAGDGFDGGMKQIVADRLRANLASNFRQTMTGFYHLIYHAENVDDEKKEKLNKIFKSSLNMANKQIALNTLTELYEGDYREAALDIGVPTLLISGSLDKICSPAASRYFAAQIQNAALEIIDDAGHMPFFTRAEESNIIIRDFLGQVYAR